MYLGGIMIGSSSPINAIACPKLSDNDEYPFINMHMLLYSFSFDYPYRVDNYDVFSFCSSPSNMSISCAWSIDHQDYINAIALRHDRKMLNIDVYNIIRLDLDYSEGKLVSFGRNKYLEAKYKFLTGDEITCLHEVKNNELSKKKKLGISYIKDITLKDFYIDPKTIYYFITFLAEVYDRLIRHGEYNLEEYYKDKLKDKFKDFESLFKYIKRRYFTHLVHAIGNGILYIAIEYKRTSQQSVLFEIFVINQDGNIYMVSEIPEHSAINVFYNVINKTAKVITYEHPSYYFGEYVLSDKGLIWTYLNNKGERLIFDANSLELVPIGLKDTIRVNFSYEKEFNTEIFLELCNDLFGIFGLVYEDILIPKNIIFVYDEYGGKFSADMEFGYMYSGSACVPIIYEGIYEVNKIFKYTLWKR